MGEGDTWTNALVGAAIGVVAGPVIPFATVLGGAVAGYLQGGTREEGIKIGALAGLIALLPFLLLVFFLSNLFLGVFVGGFGVPREFAGLGVVFVLFALLFSAVYTVVFSAAGGWLGNYVKYDTNINL